MGLGSTAKKLQTVADRAEELYGRMNEVRDQLKDLKGTVEETGDRVEDLDTRVERQEVVLEALAEEQGIDVDALLAEAAIEDAEEAAGGDGSDSGGSGTGGQNASPDGTTGGSGA